MLKIKFNPEHENTGASSAFHVHGKSFDVEKRYVRFDHGQSCLVQADEVDGPWIKCKLTKGQK